MAFTADKVRQGVQQAAAGGYSVDNSLRFNDDDTAYLSRTLGTSNRRTFTFSTWFKTSVTGSTVNILDTGNYGIGEGMFSIYIGATGRLNVQDYNQSTDTYNLRWGTPGTGPLYRDPSAWYHLIVSIDTTQASASDRCKVYINGSDVSSQFTQTNSPSQNSDFHINNGYVVYLGGMYNGTRDYDGYLAEVNFIDGQALDHTSFGETGDYGEWKLIAYAGTYGNNGFYLDFKTAGTGTTGAGKDVSGKGNHWATSGISSTDQMLDSPTNNFCTWNSIDPTPEGIANTITEGNLQVRDSSGGYNWVIATQGMSSGKWYWEVYVDTVYNYQIIGVHAGGDTSRAQSHLGGESDGWGWSWYNGRAYNSDSYVSTGTATTGDIVQVAVDIDAGKIWWGKNNTWENSGNPSAGTSPIYSGLPSFLQPAFSIYGANSTNRITTNFGQDSSFAGGKTAQGNQDSNSIGDFYYEPPTDFLALCTSNLPDPAVVPSEHFNTVTYAGNSTVTSHTGLGFQPDLCWFKRRSGADSHLWYDAVRGNNKVIKCNNTGAEGTDGTDTFKSFDSDGFTLGTRNELNHSSHTFVAWNWKANGTGVSNTNGSITSSVSANADAGFSIVSYSGTGANATVGHGLSSAPEMLIVKKRNDNTAWEVLHSGIASDYETDRIKLNDNISPADSATHWNDTQPTNSVFSLGSEDNVNSSGNPIIAYCFHSVEGFSKVGSYTGNGSADGTFVYTGFRPAYAMVKATASAEHWMIFDSERSNYNVVDDYFKANDVDAEDVNHVSIRVDFLSNGFKVRGSNAGVNHNGNTMIYLSFAEHPFKHTNAR